MVWYEITYRYNQLEVNRQEKSEYRRSMMKLFSKKKVMKFELDVIEEDLILTLKSQLAQVSTAYQVEDAFNTLRNKYGIENIIYSSKKTK